MKGVGGSHVHTGKYLLKTAGVLHPLCVGECLRMLQLSLCWVCNTINTLVGCEEPFVQVPLVEFMCVWKLQDEGLTVRVFHLVCYR